MKTKPCLFSTKLNQPDCASRGWLPRAVGFLILLVLMFLGAQNSRAVGSPNLVISEIYGGGGNNSATYSNDFVVVYNRGTTNVDVNGWSIQYASATGTGGWSVGTLASSSTIIPPGGYFLVKMASSAAVGGSIGNSDASATGINMSASSGKVALCKTTTALNGGGISGTPTNTSSIVDIVGFGSPNYSETAPAPGGNNTNSMRRISDCTDTDNNSSDFAVALTPTPRNSLITPSPCGAGAPPDITVAPTNQTVFKGTTAQLIVVATGTPAPTYQWYKGNLSTPLSNGGQIIGATSNVLTITNVTSANDDDYYVIATNPSGSDTNSPAAHLTVANDPPIWVLHPSDRTVLSNTTARFTAIVVGALPITYRWQKDGLDLSDNSQISGSSTPVLTISNVTGDNAGNYTLIVTNEFSAGPDSSSANLTVNGTGTLAFWDFNGLLFDPVSPPTSQGDAAAVASLVQTSGFVNSNSASVDPLDFGDNNISWGTSTYPPQGTSNKLTGVQFKVSTAGYRNIQIAYDQRGSATASRYSHLQYTTNGTTFNDFPFSSSFSPTNTSYQTRTFDLSGFPGVKDNTNFAIRVVAEFESTATFGDTNNPNYLGNISSYNPGPTGSTLSYDLVSISADATNGTAVPSISSTNNLTVLDTDAPTNRTFTISGGDGFLITSASSGNHNVLNDPSFVNNNDGTATLTITPQPGQIGTAPIIVRVTDSDGDSAATWFNFTVNPGNFPPTISAIPNTNTLVGVPVTIPFTIGDDQTPIGNLTIATNSTNPTLVPYANVSIGGSGSSRTITVTPYSTNTGVAPITITVTDDGPGTPKSTTIGFVVMVRPSTDIILNDNFDYPDGSLTAQSFNFWQNHSGTPGTMVSTNQELWLNATNSEDANALLIGQPISSNSPAPLYASFKVRFTALPSQNGSYFAHFKDENTGAATGFGARVWASTLNAAAGMFRLGIANGAGATNIAGQFPVDLSLGTTYTVVTKFVPLTGQSTIWVDPTSDTDLNITATDIGTAARSNQISVLSYAFRQAGGNSPGEEGVKYVNDLKVGLSFTAVTGLAPSAPPPSPTIGKITVLGGGPGGSVVLSGTNNNGTTAGTYRVLSSTNISLPLSNWTALVTNSFNADGTFNYTNGPSTNAQQFYLLQVP